ncbi:coiled-coil domain-containing protein 89 [Sphaeramia orbicularis]|uniref:coiled-coil domain-containing protein 89 n=1 Tax=Sphaeramia orbicularis TaxID=375764 RepID=UPI00117DA3A0|nr:coiled-coil domain-containing protein 89 [Sphaeramia orbicularis]
MSQKSPENVAEAEGNTAQPVDSEQNIKEKLWVLSADDAATEMTVLRSRIGEQSSLICILKHRADELLLRCQALQEINTELEDRMRGCQKERDAERKKVEIIEKRFMHLAANNQAIITFKDEYKKQNAQLMLENKQLKSENETLFSKKLQDKEEMVQKLTEEIKLLTEKYTNKENENREKMAEYQSKLLKQATHYQDKEASLLDKVHIAEQLHRDLRQKLKKAEEEHTLKENNMMERIANLSKEKDKLLHLSKEREKLIQEKREEIQQLEKKWKEEKKVRAEVEKRFEREAEAVKIDAKVKSLQCALDEYVSKNEELEKDFKAFREHSSSLLMQERELNKKLRHLNG